MMIVFEGVDASGKSSVARKLSEANCSFVYYPTPPSNFMKIREEIDRDYPPEEHCRFYMRAVIYAACELAKMKEKGVNVCVDRYWMSTVAYHRAMGVEISLSDFGDIIMPDKTFYLNVSPHIQMRRLFRRGLSEGDKRMLNQQILLRIFFQELIKSTDNVEIIDTDNKSVDETVDIVMMSVHELQKGFR